MRDNDPNPSDPQKLVGVLLLQQHDESRDVACRFTEEFVRLGQNRERILWMFRNPFYRLAHSAYLTLGPEEIEAIVDECLVVWARDQRSVSRARKTA